jgi:hypothetical protein
MSDNAFPLGFFAGVLSGLLLSSLGNLLDAAASPPTKEQVLQDAKALEERLNALDADLDPSATPPSCTCISPEAAAEIERLQMAADRLTSDLAECEGSLGR